MRITTSPSGVLLVALLVAAAVTAEPPQNDAGTHADASNSRLLPTTLSSFGTYSGQIRSQDQDWYGVASSSSAPWCAQLTASGDTFSWMWLGLRTASTDRGVAGLTYNSTTPAVHLSLAGSGVTQTYSGVDPVLNPATNSAARPGAYNFTLAGAGPSSGADAGTGKDAGSMLAGALPIASGCTSGQLHPLNGVGDASDLYSFSASAGQQVVYSLGSASGLTTLALRSADGSWAGPAISTNGIANVTLPSTGSYHFTVAQNSGTSVVPYLIGMNTLDPGCKPACLLSTSS